MASERVPFLFLSRCSSLLFYFSNFQISLILRLFVFRGYFIVRNPSARFCAVLVRSRGMLCKPPSLSFVFSVIYAGIPPKKPFVGRVVTLLKVIDTLLCITLIYLKYFCIT